MQSGVATNGQGHFTAFAQIAATTFHLPPAMIEVRMNDSALPAYGIGTFGSRTIQVSGSAVLLAAEAVREKALQVAARMLEVAPSDLVLEDGRVMVQGVPARAFALGEIARMVEEKPDLIEREASNPANGVPIEGLAAWRDFIPSSATFSSGAHLAVVEVDTDTGEVHILTYVAVDDCGRVLNHYLAEAQVHGGLAQGIGQALYEEAMYDQNGQPADRQFDGLHYAQCRAGTEFCDGCGRDSLTYQSVGCEGCGRGWLYRRAASYCQCRVGRSRSAGYQNH